MNPTDTSRKPALEYAWQLCRRLRESGTGEGKLTFLRDFITKKPTATAVEGLQYLHSTGRCSPETLAKAESLVWSGRLPSATAAAAAAASKPVFVEDELGALHGQAQAIRAAELAAAPVKPVQVTPPPAPEPDPEAAAKAAEAAEALAREAAAKVELERKAAEETARQKEQDDLHAKHGGKPGKK